LAAAQNRRPQTTATLQRRLRRLARHRVQIAAWFARSLAAQLNLTDAETDPDERVQIDAAGLHVAP
jgi:hypothetical protein